MVHMVSIDHNYAAMAEVNNMQDPAANDPLEILIAEEEEFDTELALRMLQAIHASSGHSI
jgi:hypothetical protein